jgi:hypothetical protein
LGNRFAAVVTGEGCYGMMRMYHTLAEIHGPRSASRSFVSRDMPKAVAWLATEMPGVSSDVLCGELEAIAEDLRVTSTWLSGPK